MKLDKFLIASGFIGPLIFFLTVYFVFPLFYPSYNPLFEGISQLGELVSPVSLVTNVFGFSLFGIFIMLFSIGVYRYKEFGSMGKITAFLLFISGIMIYFVGVFPDTTMTGGYTLMSKVHQFFADTPYLPIAIAFLLFIYIFLKNEKFSWIIPFIVILGPLSLVAMYYYNFYPGEIPFFNDWRGIIQRIAIGLPFVVIALIASAMYKNSE